MLKLFNTLGRKLKPFEPVNRKLVTMFTCGPSVYQRAHIGNFRTFLFEDVLDRYLEFSGYNVKRGMNFTDIEDKAIAEAKKKKTTVQRLADANIRIFLKEMKLLGMEIPDYLPKASECVDQTAEIIRILVKKGIAYRHGGNVYFDPLRFPGFGKLYGLDMSRWPKKKRRFHRDTYPGNRWNLGDFILWHGYKQGDEYCWEAEIGRGRPSWNIQDPGIVAKYFTETLSLYCGGIDNLYRHHDYTRAIVQSVRPYPMARFWLHCHLLTVNGQKMSKSRGNILYTDDLRRLGYSMQEIRFFLIYAHYRERLDYSEKRFESAVRKLRTLKSAVKKIGSVSTPESSHEGSISRKLRRTFVESMDDDLHVQQAFDGLYTIISGIDRNGLKAAEASAIISILRQIDTVLGVIF
ncbi:MAG: class I tRNA ligase family protein [Nitrospirota bacterium]